MGNPLLEGLRGHMRAKLAEMGGPPGGVQGSQMRTSQTSGPKVQDMNARRIVDQAASMFRKALSPRVPEAVRVEKTVVPPRRQTEPDEPIEKDAASRKHEHTLLAGLLDYFVENGRTFSKDVRAGLILLRDEVVKGI